MAAQKYGALPKTIKLLKKRELTRDATKYRVLTETTGDVFDFSNPAAREL